MRRIKVLEVIRQGQIGGGESHLIDLVSFFNKNQFEPICLSFSNGEMIRQLKEMGIKCYIIKTQKPFDIKIQRQIVELVSQENIQLIHAHGSRAASNMLWSAKKLHIPFIYTVHGWSFHKDQNFLVRKFRQLSEKLICNMASRVICVSQSNADTGMKSFGLKEVTVIENGINLSRFNRRSKFTYLRTEFGFTADDFVVGFIARCTKQKAPLNYLEAIRIAHNRNPFVKGLFVGEGDMDEVVNTYIAAHQMESYIYRSKFRTDVPDLLYNINVYCLPSLWEGLSIALLEAMAMGKAIVATPTDGTKELITHEDNGMIIPFGQPEALANTILRLYDDHTFYEHCCNKAHQLVEKRFNAQRVTSAVEDIYRTLLN